MIRGTTPTITITISNPGELDLTTALEVYVTVRQNRTAVTLNGEDIDVETAAVSFALTQEQSFKFREGAAEAQINWLYQSEDGPKREATKWTAINIGRQLLEQVI